MVIGMIVQAVTNKQGEPKTTPSGTVGTVSSAVPPHVNQTTTSPIPKSPSYHSNLDQAGGGKEFSFTKASLESVRSPNLSMGIVLADDHEQQQLVAASNLNPFNNMGSPLRPRDRNAYNAPPSSVQNLPSLKGALFVRAHCLLCTDGGRRRRRRIEEDGTEFRQCVR